MVRRRRMGYSCMVASNLLFHSSNKDHRNVKIVMAQNSVDVWRIGSDGEVDMRMSRPLSAVVLRYIPLCRIVVKSVEAHVQAAEQEMTSRQQSDGEQTSQVSSNQKEMNTFKNLVSEAEMKGQSWLNEYVSICCNACMTLTYSICFMYYSTTMIGFLNGTIPCPRNTHT